MISILVNNENLDLYEDNEINFEWTSFAFSKTVKEPYSTDFTIPKSSKNIRLLGIYNLQDELVFDFQEDYIKGVLIVDEKPKNINIQIIKVNKDEISIFIVESNSVADFLSKNLVKKFDGDSDGILIDSNDTIFPWAVESTQQYPNNFLSYNYGGIYNSYYAQRHASAQVVNVLGYAMRSFGVRTAGIFNNVDRNLHDKIYLLAQNKYVCPQNKKQIIRGRLDTNGIYVYGGQHVTNDLSRDINTEKTIFNINRDCCLKGQITISFYSTKNFTSNPTFILVNNETGTVVFSISIPAMTYTNRVIQYDINSPLIAGDYYFTVTDASKFENRFAFYMTAVIDDYTTTKDDTGIDLEYYHTFGAPTVYNKNGNEVTYFHDALVGGKQKTKCDYTSKFKGSVADEDVSVYTEKYYYSYFGYYCNLPEIKIRELVYNLSWITNSKVSFDRANIIEFVPFTMIGLENDYEINSTEFLDDNFGKTTCFKCKNEELADVNANDAFNINNKWLNDRVAIKESQLAKLYKDSTQKMVVNQYSDFEYDKDTNEYKCSYDEVEGLCIGVLNETNPSKKFLEPIEYFIPSNIGTTYPHISRLLLDSVKQIYKINITCYNTKDLSKYDFLNIDGRLYYIISGTKNIEDNYTNIKALLINDTEAFLFNEDGELITWQ